jgi:hypothetical protein
MNIRKFLKQTRSLFNPSPEKLGNPALINSEFHQTANNTQTQSHTTPGYFSTANNTINKKTKKILSSPIFLPAIIVSLLVIALGFFIINRTKSQPQATLGAQDEKTSILEPQSSQTINKTFTFPLKDSAGKQVSSFKYEIQDTQLRDEIIIKGQKATAVQGRTFLVMNLKITNDYNKSIQINSRDFIRLIVDNSAEKLAPDIHNDPVEIQAISTKYTRLALPINDTVNNLTLQVGEITGNKEYINLNLK